MSAVHAHVYQLPDAPPPPELPPPPPLSLSLSLGLLLPLELLPEYEPSPPDQPLSLSPGVVASASNITRNEKMAAITDSNQMPTTNHAISATSPAITTAAASRLRAARSMAPTMSSPIRTRGM